MQSDVILTDHTVFERAHGGDMVGRSADHGKRLFTNLDDLVGRGIHGNHAWLIEHNALTVHVHEHGTGTKVDADITAEIEV